MNCYTTGEEREEICTHEFDQLSPSEKVWALVMMAFVLGGKDLIDEQMRKFGEGNEQEADDAEN